MKTVIFDKINMLSDDYIVIGVSSGPDSMALLHMAIKNLKKTIICCHINHNVRDNSNLEEQYLKDYCQKNKIIFESVKISTYSENNFEDEARKKRYAFYEKILKKYNSHTLLLAHHGDDLIETVLMKIIRGSNLEGYAGIKMFSKQKTYTIIRPLLNLTKEDILKYNKEHKIKYYIDESNNDEAYTRNRYRKNILPILKREDKNIHLKFLKYSNTLQEYYNYIEDIVKDKIKRNYKNNIININLFNKEHTFIKKNIIFYLLSKIYNDKANIIKNKHIDSIIKLTENRKPNLIINLPNNYIAIKEYNYIYIKKNSEKIKLHKIEFKDYYESDNIIIKKLGNNKKISDNSNNVCKLNSKNISLPLYIRTRKNGDYIETLGLNGKKKIKEIFIEAKIPTSKRDNYPLLVDAKDNVLWIPNIKKSKYNVKNNELYDIILTSYNESEEKNEH